MLEAEGPSHRMPHRPAPASNSTEPDGPDARCSAHEQAEPRLLIAVVTVVVACAVVSVWAFLNAVMNELRADLPAGDVSVAASLVSRVT